MVNDNKPFEQRPLAVAAFIAVIMSLLAISGNTNAMAQYGAFQQPIEVYLSKGEIPLDDYKVDIMNENSGETASNYYTDSYSSPREVIVPATLSANEGDPISACVTIVATGEFACGSDNARFNDPTTTLFVDMGEAIGGYGGGGSVDQFQP
jgi:hypothetical protein